VSVPLKEKINTIFKLLFEPKTISALVSQRYTGYLLDVGWFNSFKSNNALDKENNPIPWFTYPIIDFISDRLSKDLEILEFGAGNSTLFFAQRVKTVVSIEHNERWHKKISQISPPNVKIILESNLDNYSKKASDLNMKFDVIIIDGEKRNSCIINSVEILSESGVIVLDDSEREEYRSGISYLRLNNFKSIDFWGIAPGILFKKCTTIFYKRDNCLGI
jgi:hypothetical protein